MENYRACELLTYYSQSFSWPQRLVASWLLSLFLSGCAPYEPANSKMYDCLKRAAKHHIVIPYLQDWLHNLFLFTLLVPIPTLITISVRFLLSLARIQGVVGALQKSQCWHRVP